MKNIKNFPFEKFRRITLKEAASARKAIEKKTGQVRSPRVLKNQKSAAK